MNAYLDTSDISYGNYNIALKYLLCGSLLGPQRLRVVLRDEVVDHLVLGDDVDDLVGQALPVADVGGDVDEGGGEARRRVAIAALFQLLAREERRDLAPLQQLADVLDGGHRRRGGTAASAAAAAVHGERPHRTPTAAPS